LLEEGRNIYMQRKLWSEFWMSKGEVPQECQAWVNADKVLFAKHENNNNNNNNHNHNHHQDHIDESKLGCPRGTLCRYFHDPERSFGCFMKGAPNWRHAIAYVANRICTDYLTNRNNGVFGPPPRNFLQEHLKTCKIPEHISMDVLEERAMQMIAKDPDVVPGARDDPLHPPLFLDVNKFAEEFYRNHPNAVRPERFRVDREHQQHQHQHQHQHVTSGVRRDREEPHHHQQQNQQQQTQQQQKQLAPLLLPTPTMMMATKVSFPHPLLSTPEDLASFILPVPVPKIVSTTVFRSPTDIGAATPIATPPPMLLVSISGSSEKIIRYLPPGMSPICWPPPFLPTKISITI
jgi:hypothetical protein